jgi:hypothetical protein
MSSQIELLSNQILTSNLKMVRYYTECKMVISKDRTRTEDERKLKTEWCDSMIKYHKRNVINTQKLINKSKKV